MGLRASIRSPPTCYPAPDPTACPTGQLAIVLDSVVISTPSIRIDRFNGQAEITASFTELEAKRLAAVLQSGALPVGLQISDVRR